MAKSKKIEQADVQAVKPGLFSSRLTEGEAKCEGVTFKLRALKSRQGAFAQSRALNDKGDLMIPELLHWFFKLGVIGWEGLTDENGKPVRYETTELSIMGEKTQVVVNRLVDGLPQNLILIVGAYIQQMSRLSPDELIRLDFS